MREEKELLEWVKKKLPELLRTDEEFRTLVLGALVQYLPTREEFVAILERLERIERELEDLRREQAALRQDFAAMQQTLVEQGRILTDQGKAIEGLQRVVAEQGRAIAELQKAVAEQGRAIAELQRAVAEQGRAIAELQQAVLELGQAVRELFERVERLEAAHERLAGEVQGLRADFTRLERRVDSGFARFGILSEDVLRRALQVAIETWLKAGRVQTIEVAGRQVDVVIRDAEHIILEVTARAHLQDIDKLKLTARAYEQQFGIAPRLAIACAYATPVVIQRLMEEGIEVISAEVPE